MPRCGWIGLPPGEVSERSKEHAWKVCIRQRIEGSNPSFSASQNLSNSQYLCEIALKPATCGAGRITLCGGVSLFLAFSVNLVGSLWPAIAGTFSSPSVISALFNQGVSRI